MSDVTIIDGFLTLKKGNQILTTNEPSILYIGASADGENWDHKWYIENVPLPVSIEEATRMFEDSLGSLANVDDADAWFDVAFTERNGTRTFTGKAIMHSLAYAGVKVALQGVTELAS